MNRYYGLLIVWFMLCVSGCSASPNSRPNHQYSKQSEIYREDGTNLDRHVINIRNNYFAYLDYGTDGLELLNRPTEGKEADQGLAVSTDSFMVNAIATLGWNQHYLLLRTRKGETYNTINNHQITGQYYIVVNLDTQAMAYYKTRTEAEEKCPPITHVLLKKPAAYPWFAHFYYGKNRNQHR